MVLTPNASPALFALTGYRTADEARAAVARMEDEGDFEGAEDLRWLIISAQETRTVSFNDDGGEGWL